GSVGARHHHIGLAIPGEVSYRDALRIAGHGILGGGDAETAIPSSHQDRDLAGRTGNTYGEIKHAITVEISERQTEPTVEHCKFLGWPEVPVPVIEQDGTGTIGIAQH